mmetsp:Transcript_26434/g.67099  ORF Transcript_26434/g.67099 Transcript_26434/m.67099 type:complete len:215 (-) Transcript_26434:71-715(-)
MLAAAGSLHAFDLLEKFPAGHLGLFAAVLVWLPLACQARPLAPEWVVFAPCLTEGALGCKVRRKRAASALGAARRVGARDGEERDRLLGQHVADRLEWVQRHAACRARRLVLRAHTPVALRAHDVAGCALKHIILGKGEADAAAQVRQCVLGRGRQHRRRMRAGRRRGYDHHVGRNSSSSRSSSRCNSGSSGGFRGLGVASALLLLGAPLAAAR